MRSSGVETGGNPSIIWIKSSIDSTDLYEFVDNFVVSTKCEGES